MAAVVDAKSGKTFSAGFEEVEVVYDFAADAGATGALDLFTASQDMMVKVTGKVKTGVTSGGAATLEVGKSGATAAAIAQVAKTAADTAGEILQPAGWMYLASGEVLIQTIGTAALTAGKIAYLIEYRKF